MQISRDEDLIVSHPITHQGQDHHPYASPQSCKKTEQSQVHPCHPGGKGDVLPDPRQKPPHKGGDMTMFAKETLCLIKGPFAYQ